MASLARTGLAAQQACTWGIAVYMLHMPLCTKTTSGDKVPEYTNTLWHAVACSDTAAWSSHMQRRTMMLCASVPVRVY
jgi:hypothetical protein